MNGNGNTVAIPVADLKVALFVRRELDQDRVNQFALHYIDSINLGPLLVNEKYEIIDGRHRHAAAKMAEVPTLECMVRHFASAEEELLTAFMANLGGALPPTTEDFYYVVNQLMDQGLSRRQVMNRFAEKVPKEIMGKYCTEVTSRRYHANMLRARAAVSNGELKVTEAAEKFGVELPALKDLLAGVKKADRSVVRELGAVKLHLASRHKSLSGYIQKTMADLFRRFDDGTIGADSIEKIFEHIDAARKRSAHMLDDFRQRFEALKKGESKS